MASAKTIQELRQLSRDDLIAQHDAEARNTVVGTKYYLEELARRDSEEAEHRMLALTKQMRDLTVVILILTLINLVALFASFFR